MSHMAFLVKGVDDERFVEDVLEPKLDQPADVIKYSQKPNDSVDEILGAFRGVCDGHYFVTDLDRGQQDCENCDDREDYERDRYDIQETFDILVAIDAVEGWYLAGVSDELATEKLVPVSQTTEHVGKSEFDDVFTDSEFTSKQLFMTEITNDFDYDLARERNDSFRYVCDLLGV